jgi:hypothetical protein
MEKLLYFNTATEDSLAVPASNLYLIDAGNDVVTLYFTPKGANGSLLSSVVLNCADGASDALCLAIAQACVGGRADEVIVVADDANSTYVDSAITSVGAIVADVTVAFA